LSSLAPLSQPRADTVAIKTVENERGREKDQEREKISERHVGENKTFLIKAGSVYRERIERKPGDGEREAS
jgi:hypothetical protein